MTRVPSRRDGKSRTGPKHPFSYSEDANEAPTSLEEEPVDVEEGTPADRRNSIEGEPSEAEEAPLFEE